MIFNSTHFCHAWLAILSLEIEKVYRDFTNLSTEIIDNMFLLFVTIALVDCKIDRMDWRVQQPCKFVEAKESVYMKTGVELSQDWFGTPTCRLP